MFACKLHRGLEDAVKSCQVFAEDRRFPSCVFARARGIKLRSLNFHGKRRMYRSIVSCNVSEAYARPILRRRDRPRHRCYTYVGHRARSRYAAFSYEIPIRFLIDRPPRNKHKSCSHSIKNLCFELSTMRELTFCELVVQLRLRIHHARIARIVVHPIQHRSLAFCCYCHVGSRNCCCSRLANVLSFAILPIIKRTHVKDEQIEYH